MLDWKFISLDSKVDLLKSKWTRKYMDDNFRTEMDSCEIFTHIDLLTSKMHTQLYDTNVQGEYGRFF